MRVKVYAFIPGFLIEGRGFYFVSENINMKITFIIGGARSGKSSFALREASGMNGHKLYIATAEALDDEMRERIAKHKSERGTDWDTIEEPMDIAGSISGSLNKYNVGLLDCLTLWLSNIMIRTQ
ncbi:MAG: bifunctional adenosylcobinamide kinase/adenosylcobinamide-phosphate guanylyltransferase, partial [Pseudomonadota bacterium]